MLLHCKNSNVYLYRKRAKWSSVYRIHLFNEKLFCNSSWKAILLFGKHSFFYDSIMTFSSLNIPHKHAIRNDVRQPWWLSSLVPAFSPGCDPGDPGSSPTSSSSACVSAFGSGCDPRDPFLHWVPCREPASPSACISASLSLCLSWINK